MIMGKPVTLMTDCRRPELYMLDLCEKRDIPLIAYGTLVGL